jgi:hypothetical protein
MREKREGREGTGTVPESELNESVGFHLLPPSRKW